MNTLSQKINDELSNIDDIEFENKGFFLFHDLLEKYELTYDYEEKPTKQKRIFKIYHKSKFLLSYELPLNWSFNDSYYHLYLKIL